MPVLKKTKSPTCSFVWSEMLVPINACCLVVRGNLILNLSVKVRYTKPEQSMPDFDSPPNWYLTDFHSECWLNKRCLTLVLGETLWDWMLRLLLVQAEINSMIMEVKITFFET